MASLKKHEYTKKQQYNIGGYMKSKRDYKRKSKYPLNREEDMAGVINIPDSMLIRFEDDFIMATPELIDAYNILASEPKHKGKRHYED